MGKMSENRRGDFFDSPCIQNILSGVCVQVDNIEQCLCLMTSLKLDVGDVTATGAHTMSAVLRDFYIDFTSLYLAFSLE